MALQLHMLQTRVSIILDKPCSIQDLAAATKTAMMCVNKWKRRSKEKETDDGLDKKKTHIAITVPINVIVDCI